MQRVTISLDEQLARDFDELLKSQSYQSRSEAVRDLVRDAVESRRLTGEQAGQCVANLSYVYNHATRSLAQRLIEIGHQQHDLVVSTMHVHLDHEDCLETVVLQGDVAKVRAFADGIKAERGVRFAELNLVRVRPNDEHDGHHHSHGSHQHMTPAQS